MRSRIMILLAALVAPSVQSFAAPPQYVITDLGAAFSAKNTGSAAYSINNSGVIVGSFNGQATEWYGPQTTLPPFFGDTAAGAMSINASNQVVGSSGTSNFRAVLWVNGVTGDINILAPVAYATGIDNSTDIIGQYRLNNNNSTFAFYWQNGTTTTIPMLGSTSATAAAINNAGVSTGTLSGGPPGISRPYTYQNGITTLLPTGNNGGGAFGINDDGVVSGYTVNNGNFTPTLWIDGVETTLPEVPGFVNGQVWATDADGVSVGIASPSSGGGGGAAVWVNGQGYLLSSLITNSNNFTKLGFTYDINDSGQIVGMGYQGDTQDAFLLTPVPEPVMPAFAGIGIALLTLQRRRRVL